MFSIKKSVSFLLAGSIVVSLFSLSGCRKNRSKSSSDNQYYSGKEIRESDPYFQSEIFPLELPIKQGRDLENAFVSKSKYINGLIVGSYSIFYKRPDNPDPGDDWEYYVTGIGLFDAEGKYIRELPVPATNILGIDADKDGNICILSFKSSIDGGSSAISRLNSKGDLLDSVNVPQIPYSNEQGTHMEFTVLEDGRYLINGTEMGVFGKDGEKLFTVSDQGRIVRGPLILQDGKYYIQSIRMNDLSREIKLKEIDLNTGKLGQGFDAGYLEIYKDLLSTPEGLYSKTANGLSKLDIKTGKAESFFNWNDTDIDRNYLSETQPYVLNENELLVICRHFTDEGYSTYLLHLTRTGKNPHAGKKMIILKGASLQLEFELLAFVNKYNLDPSSKARVILIDDSEEQSYGEDQAKSQQTLTLELLSGTGADILFGYANQSLFQSSTLMLDLNPYIDGPNGFSRDEYFDNVFRAMEKGGKLYHIPARINLQGFQINTDYIHQKIGWSFSEFDACGKELRDNVSFLEGIDQQLLLMYLLSSQNDFINYDSKTVNFQNETMKTILRLAKEYGVKEKPKDEGQRLEYAGGGSYFLAEDQTTAKFNSGLLAARLMGIASLENLSLNKNVLKEKSAYLGYPSPNGSGMAADPISSLGISASSQYADLAWDFIRAYLCSDYEPQRNTFGIPVRKASFEKECRIIMERCNREYEQGVREKSSAQDLLTFYCRPTEADIDELREMVENVSVSTCNDPNILNIILEEAGAYFAGDRTEDDVLKKIQDRASTVMKEL